MFDNFNFTYTTSSATQRNVAYVITFKAYLDHNL